MEYMPCGDLLGYLRKCRGVKDRYYLGDGRAQDLETYDLVLFAKQIAAGMVFLGSRGVSEQNIKCFSHIDLHSEKSLLWIATSFQLLEFNLNCWSTFDLGLNTLKIFSM